MTPTLIITPGEPAGIGPDLVLAIAQQCMDIKLVIAADPTLLQQRAKLLNLDIEIKVLSDISQATTHVPGMLAVLPVRLKTPVICGQLNKDNADYVLETLRIATQACLQGTADALVTGPVHKAIINEAITNEAKIPFTGHTEFLAELTNSYPVMMLASGELRVALVTTHLPLSEVSQAITTATLSKVLKILNHDLEHTFAIHNPHIAVCGLNPHAGEDGYLGHEEIDTIIPVLNKLRSEGLNLSGPHPADTLFTTRNLQGKDAVLAMYHDQGLPVLKHAAFGQAVNITLGLPIIRTSVDHGTALELAGRGKAETGSLMAAIEMARTMAVSGSKTSAQQTKPQMMMAND
ncbi:MAG: 4-hydroxythreonine-4-phosphate dehydrogenase PdxA [Gammaproteobacteria bacterium]|nr:4-hydroxythreonine-4-phosphate dehydrogenase PdxA [Gammaproteobacteria bacterium]